MLSNPLNSITLPHGYKNLCFFSLKWIYSTQTPLPMCLLHLFIAFIYTFFKNSLNSLYACSFIICHLASAQFQLRISCGFSFSPKDFSFPCWHEATHSVPRQHLLFTQSPIVALDCPSRLQLCWVTKVLCSFFVIRSLKRWWFYLWSFFSWYLFLIFVKWLMNCANITLTPLCAPNDNNLSLSAPFANYKDTFWWQLVIEDCICV